MIVFAAIAYVYFNITFIAGMIGGTAAAASSEEPVQAMPAILVIILTIIFQPFMMIPLGMTIAGLVLFLNAEKGINKATSKEELKKPGILNIVAGAISIGAFAIASGIFCLTFTPKTLGFESQNQAETKENK